jgi:hypothetical protein
MERDSRARDARTDPRLYDVLEEIEGVFEVDYDRCFGHFIFLKIEGKYDSLKTWEDIIATIRTYGNIPLE